MPEDTEVSEQQELESGFDAATGEPEKKPEKKPEAEPEKKEESKPEEKPEAKSEKETPESKEEPKKESKPEEPEKEEPEKKPEPKPEDKPTEGDEEDLLKAADERGKALAEPEKEEPEKKEPEPEKKEEQGDSEEVKALKAKIAELEQGKPVTLESIVESIEDEGLKETFTSMQKDYPDAMKAMFHIAQASKAPENTELKEQVKALTEKLDAIDGQFTAQAEAKKAMEQAAKDLTGGFEQDGKKYEGIKDALTILNDKDFVTWKDKQGENVQRLFDSDKVVDVHLLISAYKQSVAKAAKDAAKKDDKKKLEDSDAVHGESLDKTAKVAPTDDKTDAAELKGGFEDEVDKLVEERKR
jgi:hypothetical protein